jgi:Flp pilus assembly protein TadG
LRNNFWKGEEGAAMVEFAVVATFFTVILLGIMEAGLAAWQKNSVAADAREGARYAAVHGNRSGSPATVLTIRAYVKNQTTLQKTGTDSIRVYASWPTDKETGSFVSVSVAHPVPRRGPFIPAHVDSATSTMVILY